MDLFFARFLSMSEAAMMGTAFVLIVLGGLVASRVFSVIVAFRRVTYLWFLTLLSLALSISQYAWTYVPVAAESGFFSAMVMLSLSTFAIFGAGIYYASAARSRHIYGTTRRAWMGFVPFANLVLLFKPGRFRDIGGIEQPRSPMARFFLDPILVLGAIIVFTALAKVDRAVEQAPMHGAKTVEGSFAREAKLVGAHLPMRIDEITIFSEIEAIGSTLRITYDVEQELAGFLPEFRQTVIDLECSEDMFRDEIARGGTVFVDYRAPGGAIIETYIITKEDCDL